MADDEKDNNGKAPEVEPAKATENSVTKPDAEVQGEQPVSEPTVDELKALLEKTEADAKGYFAQLQRTTADFDNYRKRMLKERDEIVKGANARLLTEILEPAENLDRALEATKGAKSVRKVREGVEMTRNQLRQVLERNGLKRIAACGMPFDARLHEAVEQLDSNDVPEGTVVEEVRSGYVLNGSVLRCAKVKVSKKPKEG